MFDIILYPLKTLVNQAFGDSVVGHQCVRFTYQREFHSKQYSSNKKFKDVFKRKINNFLCSEEHYHVDPASGTQM